MKFRSLLLALVAVLTSTALAQSPQKSQETKPPILIKPDLQQSEQDFLKNAYKATVLLYFQNDSGGMSAACTATSVLKLKNGYVFLTAAHCLDADYIYYITDDKQDTKTFYAVDGAMCGMAAHGLDFCFLFVPTDHEFAVVALGVDADGIGGEPVAAISSPLGLGKQVFRGSIATPHVKRPILIKNRKDEDEGNWFDYTLFQMPGVNAASSGSALLCIDQRAICGVIVGTIATPMGAEAVAAPVNLVLEQMEKHGVATK